MRYVRLRTSAHVIDPSLMLSYVPRTEYDALKAKYDALSAGPSTSRKRRRESLTRDSPKLDASTPDEKMRKKRSMRLEVSCPLGKS